MIYLMIYIVINMLITTTFVVFILKQEVEVNPVALMLIMLFGWAIALPLLIYRRL